jgi:hypothetical protein
LIESAGFCPGLKKGVKQSYQINTVVIFLVHEANVNGWCFSKVVEVALKTKDRPSRTSPLVFPLRYQPMDNKPNIKHDYYLL